MNFMKWTCKSREAGGTGRERNTGIGERGGWKDMERKEAGGVIRRNLM